MAQRNAKKAKPAHPNLFRRIHKGKRSLAGGERAPANQASIRLPGRRAKREHVPPVVPDIRAPLVVRRGNVHRDVVRQGRLARVDDVVELEREPSDR